MGRSKQQNKIKKTGPVQQKILRQSIKKEEFQESYNQQSESSRKQVQKRGRKKKACQEIQFKKCLDNQQYLQKSMLIYPDNLQEQVFKIIIFCGNSAKLPTIIKNLEQNYENEISLQIFNEFLAEQEETGLIFEIKGFYKITSEFVNEVLKHYILLNKNCEECNFIKLGLQQKAN